MFSVILLGVAVIVGIGLIWAVCGVIRDGWTYYRTARRVVAAHDSARHIYAAVELGKITAEAAEGELEALGVYEASYVPQLMLAVRLQSDADFRDYDKREITAANARWYMARRREREGKLAADLENLRS